MSDKTLEVEAKDITMDLSVDDLKQMLEEKTRENLVWIEKVKKMELKALGVHNKNVELSTQNNQLMSSTGMAEKMAEFNYKMGMAEKFVSSGAFPCKNGAEAFVMMAAGAEMGLSEMESMQDLYLYRGKINLYGKALSKMVKRGGYDIVYSDEVSIPWPKDNTAKRNPIPNGNGVSKCKVTISNGEKVYSYEVDSTDEIILKSTAASISVKNKLRFHCLRMILNFDVPELINGVSDLFDSHHVEVMSNNKTTKSIKSDEYNSLQEELSSFTNLEDMDSWIGANNAKITKYPNLMMEIKRRKDKIAESGITDIQIEH